MCGLGRLTTLLILLAAPFAQAAGKDAKERAARKACLSGDYAKGVELLSDLFIDTMDPNYIFNQARCFEQNNRCEEAVSRFREYLRKASDLDSADKADTEKHIADCQALIAGKESPTAKPEPTTTPTPAPALMGPIVAPSRLPSPAPETTPPSTVALPATSLTERTAVTTAAQEPAHPGRALRLAGIACGVAGLASVGTAVYYYTQAKSYSDKVSNQTIPNPSDERAGKHAQTMQWVFYSAGAAAIATGTVLYVLGWQAGPGESTRAGITPVVGPGIAGISAQGAL